MPNWIEITFADLNDHKVAEMVTSLREEALGDGQTDPMPGIIAEVTTELRNAIGFSGRYQLDLVETTVPASFREHVTKKIIRVMKGRLGSALDKDDDADHAVYEARLRALVKGEWPVDKPDNVASAPTTQSASATPRIKTKCREFSRAQQEGA